MGFNLHFSMDFQKTPFLNNEPLYMSTIIPELQNIVRKVRNIIEYSRNSIVCNNIKNLLLE